MVLGYDTGRAIDRNKILGTTAGDEEESSEGILYTYIYIGLRIIVRNRGLFLLGQRRRSIEAIDSVVPAWSGSLFVE
jgi:hypothetical protein